MILWNDNISRPENGRWTAGLRTWTNLSVDTAGTQVTRATNAFSALDIGRYLHVTAGTGATPGWYKIMTYIDQKNITVDRAIGAGPLTNMSAHIEWSALLIKNHPYAATAAQCMSVFDTTVASHPSATTINTNKKFTLALTDCVSDANGTGISSATGGFTAEMVNMPFSVTAGTGWVVGMYTIVGYTDTNNITIDQSCGASKTGGSANVPYTAPPLGNLMITKASTGVRELVAYSSFQNDGSGNVQYTVTAPVQTFSSGDTVKLHDLLYANPYDANALTTSVSWELEDENKAAAPKATTNTTFLLSGKQDLLFLIPQLSYIFARVYSDATDYEPYFDVGSIDTSGEFPLLVDNCRLRFSATSNLFGNQAYVPGVSGFYIRASRGSVRCFGGTIGSATGYRWHVGGYGSKVCLVAKYATLHNFDGIYIQGAWEYKRVNFTADSGGYQVLIPSSWSAVVSAADVFFANNLKSLADGSYGTQDPTLLFDNANLPAVSVGGGNYRGYMTNMNTGDGMMWNFTDTAPIFGDDDFYGYGTAGKNWRVYQCFSRYIKVEDEQGNPISGAVVTVEGSSGQFGLTSYTTDANGWCNNGNRIVQETYRGYMTPMWWKMWHIVIGGTGTPPTITVYTVDPYTITARKAGYVNHRDKYSIGVTDSHLKTEIIIKMVRSNLSLVDGVRFAA